MGRRAQARGQQALGEAGLDEPLDERRRAQRLGLLHDGDDVDARHGAPSERSSRRAMASASSVPPADGGGLVRTVRPR